MLDPLLIAAIVEVLYQLASIYLPNIPITREMINAVILILLGLFTYRAMMLGARKFMPNAMAKAKERGLIAED